MITGRTKRAIAILLLLLGGCATGVPEALREPPAQAVGFVEAVRDLDAYRGRNVRWGGTIVDIKNRANDTLLEVLARPLTSRARPDLDAPSEGRFLVRYPGFLDPAIYATDREVTAVGKLESGETHSIGDFAYVYPVIRAEIVHLWPKRQERKYDEPYYYDPWWPHPWDPWGYPYYYPYPYYRPPYWRY